MPLSAYLDNLSKLFILQLTYIGGTESKLENNHGDRKVTSITIVPASQNLANLHESMTVNPMKPLQFGEIYYIC